MKIDKNKMEAELNLTSAHTLVMGNKPNKIELEAISNKLINAPDTEVASFGLFEVASPNYATYYPEVTAEDLTPVEADFIYPVFRMLSETIVSKGAPIDFSKKGILKGSMPLLLGQTINIDHEVAVGNAVGAVSKVYWQESYKDKSGINIPAGINAVMMIDGKSNPRIARGIMMNPPSIHSNSVTVRFKWEPSHTFEKLSEFFEQLGSYDKEGELVRMVVSDILSYHETSLVSHGADVFAQKVNQNGQIINPGYAARNYSFTADKPIRALFSMDYKSDLKSFTAGTLYTPEPTILNTNTNNNKEQNMEELINEMTELFGFEKSELTKENLATKIKEKVTEQKVLNQTLSTEKDGLSTKVTEKENEITGLTSELATANLNKAEVEAITKSTRDEAVRLFKLCKGTDADENILRLIGTADLNTAKSFVTQYQKEADEKFTDTCKKCGSNDISRSTALTTQDGLVTGDGKDKEGNTAPKDTMAVLRAMKEKNKKRSRIFGEQKD